MVSCQQVRACHGNVSKENNDNSKPPTEGNFLGENIIGDHCSQNREHAIHQHSSLSSLYLLQSIKRKESIGEADPKADYEVLMEAKFTPLMLYYKRDDSDKSGAVTQQGYITWLQGCMHSVTRNGYPSGPDENNK